MRNIYLTEEQFKKYCKYVLKEDEYVMAKQVKTFATPEEAEAYAATLRQKYGLDNYDCYVDGNTVVAMIEKDRFDDSYFDDMKSKLVAESK